VEEKGGKERKKMRKGRREVTGVLYLRKWLGEEGEVSK